jgi:signal transduction histidine kinase
VTNGNGAGATGRIAVLAPADDVTPSRSVLLRLLVRPREYRHPRAWAGFRLACGIWNLGLGIALLSFRFWVGLVPLLGSVLIFWTVYRLQQHWLHRVRELEQSRASLVDDSAARLRRIERDLHDGAQAQMVAVAMKLGMARVRLGDAAGGTAQVDLDRARELVRAAHRSAKEAITELRELARGIHPAALDSGLGPALTALAAGSAVPVSVNVELAERPSPAIETIAYFCAAELLVNMAKHSGAGQAALEAVHSPGLLRVRVTDDGAGGARLAPGGGLAGLSERVRTVDGTLQISSPPGGPTAVCVELPSHA